VMKLAKSQLSVGGEADLPYVFQPEQFSFGDQASRRSPL
jgi:hypothetical protein